MRHVTVILLALKLILGASLVTGATLAARRWGGNVGGWLAGLPLTSGPVSLFLALEQGPAFAEIAARWTLLGLIALAAFCVVDCVFGRRHWLAGVSGGVIAFLTTASLLRGAVLPPVGSSFAVVAAVLTLAARITRPHPAALSIAAPPPLDLLWRVVATTAMLVLLTGAAAVLGPRTSGLLSPFPAVAGVMATFSHVRGGPVAAAGVLHGVVLGSFAFASFFVVVASLLEDAGPLTTYTFATAAAIAAQGVMTVIDRHVRRRVGSRTFARSCSGR